MIKSTISELEGRLALHKNIFYVIPRLDRGI